MTGQSAAARILRVTSQPPLTASKGRPYAYTLRVKSKKGWVKCKLESGPQGMKVTPDGKLTWEVPRDFADAEVAVILTVSDATDQEIFHNFTLTLADR